MAIELNNRTKIMAGVVALAAVGAGAWFFFLDDFLNEPPPPPKAAAAKSAPADASKQAAADAPKKAADAPKQPADETKQAQAAAPKPAAKPIPGNPDQLIAEVLANSGIKTQFQPFALEVVLQAEAGGEAPGAAGSGAVTESLERIYQPAAINDELAANLKKNLDVERMGRFLELLRQPIVLKVNSHETRATTPEDIKQYHEKTRKDPPSAARVKLLQTIDDTTRTTEVALEMSSIIARTMVDTMLAELKGGKNVPKEARQAIASQLTTMRDQARAQVRSVLHATYRNLSDEELADYVHVLDTDTGRWGNEVLTTAIRPILSGRSSAFGAEAGKLAMARRSGPAARAPMAPESIAKMDEKSADKPAAAPAKAEVVAPAYQRPANIRNVYARYNDVVSATVMRDREAVKELLDDGKNPNARQRDGLTPLMIAVTNGDADIAGMLLAKGADPNSRAQGGNTALSLAKARGAGGAALVQMLQRSGAKD